MFYIMKVNKRIKCIGYFKKDNSKQIGKELRDSSGYYNKHLL